MKEMNQNQSFKYAKKTYDAPSMKVVEIGPSRMLAESPGSEHTGEGIPGSGFD